MKFGAEYRILRNNYYQSNQPSGQFRFTAKSTAANPQNPNNGTPGFAAAAAGNGFASFLLGYGVNDSNSNASEPAKTADQNLYWGIYAGDTYNVTRKLTVNYGVRVDLQGNWTERHDRIVALNPDEKSPLLGNTAVNNAFPNLKGGFDLVSSGRHAGRTAFAAWNHFSPRIGASYEFLPNTVIRSGYGMFYLPVDVRWNDAPHNLFINSFTTPWLAEASDGVTPKNVFSNPFPTGITPPFGRNQSLVDVQGNGNSAAALNTKAPYMQQWNVDLERQFPGELLVDVAYAASKGTHLPTHTQDIDQLQPQFLPKNKQDVANLTKLVANPFAGNCTGCTGPVQSGGVGTNATVKAAQLLLPYPQYDDFSLAEYDNRNSSYHSMQAKVQKRFSDSAPGIGYLHGCETDRQHQLRDQLAGGGIPELGRRQCLQPSRRAQPRRL